GDPEVALEAAVARATLHALLGDFAIAEAEAREALPRARRLGRGDLESLALNYIAVCSPRLDEEAVQLFTEAIEIARRGHHLEPAARAYTNLVATFVYWRQQTRALRWIEEGIAFMTDFDFPSHRFNLIGARAHIHLEQGEWAQAEQGMTELLDITADPGVLEGIAVELLARLHLRRGEADADALVDRGRAIADDSRAAQYLCPMAVISAEQAFLTGHLEDAASLTRYALIPGIRPWTLGELLVYLRRCGIDGVESPADIPIPPVWADLLRGDWASAAERWQQLGNPYEQALALADSGQPQQLLEALPLLDDLGALPAAALVRQRLRDLGVRSIPRGPQPTTRENPAGLTARQLEVLALLSDGLTNAEIADHLVVSVRTVDHHVSAVLAKLGVGSRRAAAAQALVLLADQPR
ncbi:MAG TPA: LuxR C-terminal-related transcriptional regulator, partial [Euzebya sp.]|nr:LuxR C-terminal-related transcriptional regulator [Euzebya sp.]